MRNWAGNPAKSFSFNQNLIDSALEELRTFQLPEGPWFAYLCETENGEIVREELFD